jgi:glycosyltransferase involved in cell wall biosynthesis
MVGPLTISAGIREKLRNRVELVGVVPRSEVWHHYSWADVFLLPSLCEGSATATYEALSAGLPVICTPNTGSVVRDHMDGFIVPIRDPDAIVTSLDLVAQNKELLREMSQNAESRAQDFTFKCYAERLMIALEGVRADQDARI